MSLNLDIQSYLIDDLNNVYQTAFLFSILFWRFGYSVSVEIGYDEYLRPEHYITICV